MGAGYYLSLHSYYATEPAKYATFLASLDLDRFFKGCPAICDYLRLSALDKTMFLF
jgi:hypothetical protein